MSEADTFALSSSMLSEGSYDKDTQELTLTFTNGRAYTYQGVPAELVERLKTAVSPGHFFRDNLKGRFG
jgi:KTSC domain